jgi:hypothetical protein
MYTYAHYNRNDLLIMDDIIDRNTYLPYLALRKP